MQACPQQHGRQEGLKNVMPRPIGHGRYVNFKAQVVFVLESASAADYSNVLVTYATCKPPSTVTIEMLSKLSFGDYEWVYRYG